MIKVDLINKIILGDCEDILRKFPDDSIDLIFTSPPYADARKRTYGGVRPDKYVNWFLPKAEQFLRVLKPTGTFILNIKERVVNGERLIYVIELIMGIKKQGWLWTEEFIWHKKNPFPGKWPNRFRDGWERLLQFNKRQKFNMYQETVMIPPSDATKARALRLTNADKVMRKLRTGSGLDSKLSSCVNRNMVYPTNVLHMATESWYRGHSAVFPIGLPIWFIKLFTVEGDIVLDPFVGSGTTALAAKKLGRNYIGIDIIKEYCLLAEKRVLQIRKI